MNNAQLNALASIASANGFNATKGSTLLLAIAGAIKAGADIETAFEIVAGKGSYQKFAADLYDTLRAK